MQIEEFTQRVALEIYRALDTAPLLVERMEALMGTPYPGDSPDADKSAVDKWWQEALGRYCYAQAALFVAGFEAQRAGV